MLMLWAMAFAGTMLLAVPRVGVAHTAMQSTNINQGVIEPQPVLARVGSVQGQNAMVARQQVKLAEAAASKKRA